MSTAERACDSDIATQYHGFRGNGIVGREPCAGFFRNQCERILNRDAVRRSASLHSARLRLRSLWNLNRVEDLPHLPAV
jgi:hypothetical protein